MLLCATRADITVAGYQQRYENRRKRKKEIDSTTVTRQIMIDANQRGREFFVGCDTGAYRWLCMVCSSQAPGITAQHLQRWDEEDR